MELNVINVTGVVVVFLMLIVLGMQIQLSSLSKKMGEQEQNISKKIDELLKENKSKTPPPAAAAAAAEK
ncbi:MAG TPA: hypothetical protein VMU29_05975 [Smithella sp.]|nr:hypothetical protein [Smithella sp.]